MLKILSLRCGKRKRHDAFYMLKSAMFVTVRECMPGRQTRPQASPHGRVRLTLNVEQLAVVSHLRNRKMRTEGPINYAGFLEKQPGLVISLPVRAFQERLEKLMRSTP